MMNKSILSIMVLALCLLCVPVFSQTENDTTLLGLPGDNLDLYAVLDLFQKSKTIEEFEKSLNEEKTGINNLDLNLDKKVDFIKVDTKQKDESFTFILQVDVTEKETQDVAVILVDRDKNKKVTLQIVGDKDLYGKDYVVEPKPASPASTANPAYTGAQPVTTTTAAAAVTDATKTTTTSATTPATTTVVVVESAPVIQYVYSPVYVPYHPPYHYAYYPPYFVAFTCVAISAYRHNHYYHHAAYHGGHYGGGNTVVIHNTNNYNNYNNSRHTSNTVNHNMANGSYNANRAATNQVKGASPATKPAATKKSASRTGRRARR
ncbi:MAG: hypothetical protein WCI92_15360 [Bacteroidota bacterium]